jgi:hypothetical protein
MPIKYAERKKRRQALLQGLVPELRQRLALRYVEAVIKLPPQAQRTLAEALSAGLHNIPETIATLQEHPRTSVEEVLRARKDRCQKESPASEVSSVGLPAKPDPDALAELSGLLQDCFPGMPRMTAEALAADDCRRMRWPWCGPGRLVCALNRSSLSWSSWRCAAWRCIGSMSSISGWPPSRIIRERWLKAIWPGGIVRKTGAPRAGAGPSTSSR